MTGKKMGKQHQASFEATRQIDEGGNEFWSARDLAPLLEYQDWRNFMRVVDKARLACVESDKRPEDHFVGTTKLVGIGSGAQREVEDVRLSRYACYLVVQNGDPAKPVIANGQTYFALQTRRQELADEQQFAQLTEDQKRLAIRNELATHNKHLAAAARDAGVATPLDYAIFQDHGYRGLYGGLGAKDIHARKGLKKSQKILDHMTWAARSWRPTCSAPRRPRRSCAATKCTASRGPTGRISRSGRRCARPSTNWAAPCRNSCRRLTAASGSWHRRKRSNSKKRRTTSDAWPTLWHLSPR